MTAWPRFDARLSRILRTDGHAFSILAVPVSCLLVGLLIGAPAVLWLLLTAEDFRPRELLEPSADPSEITKLIVLVAVVFGLFPLMAFGRARRVRKTLTRGLPVEGVVERAFRGPSWCVLVRYEVWDAVYTKLFRTRGPEDLSRLAVDQRVWLVIQTSEPRSSELAELYLRTADEGGLR